MTLAAGTHPGQLPTGPIGVVDMPIHSSGMPATPHGWLRPASYREAFPAGPRGEKRRRRWLKSVPPWQKHLVEGDGRRSEWLLRGDTRLPNGTTAAEFAQQYRTPTLPAEVKAGTEKTRARSLASLELRRRDQTLQLARPDLAPNSPAFYADLERLHGAWARSRGISCTPHKVRAVRIGKVADGRGRSGRRRAPRDERLAERVRETYLHANKFSRRDAAEAQTLLAAELGIRPLTDHQVRVVIDELPHAVRVLAREKPRVFEATCVPKIRTDMSDLPAGSWWVLDGREADVQVRVPDGNGGWRAVRPVVTAVVDVRSRRFLAVDVRASENALGILSGIKRALDYGAPDDVTKDNGWAYRKSGGVAQRRGGWKRAQLDDARIGGVFVELGVRIHTSLPHWAWAKIIESLWRWFKKFCDRWHASFWGGSPAERSHDAEQLVKHHVDELPTLDDFRANVLTAMETINATPRRVLGGLSPNLAFDRFRGTVRRADPAVVDLVACPLDAFANGRPKPHRVGRDGVRYRGILYELDVDELVRLQQRDVYIRADLDRVGCIRLCDEKGRPLAVATQQRLIRAGCTDDDYRDAMRKKARVRRAAKAYLPARDVLLESTTGQILRARRDRALAHEAELRRAQPAAAAPDVSIVRPDLVEACESVQRKHAARTARTEFEPRSQGAPSGFERLARKAEQEAFAERARASRPTIGQRFAALNREPDLEEEAGSPWRRIKREVAG